MVKLWQMLGSLEQVREAARHGGSGGRGDTSDAVVLRQVPHCQNDVCRVISGGGGGGVGGWEGQLLGILRLDSSTAGGTYLAPFW